MRYVTVEDIDDLVAGAMVLGGGGGGDWYAPRQMLLHALDTFGPVPLVDATDLDPRAPVLPVLSAGTPSALVEMFHGERESALLRSLVEQALPRPCAAVLPVQPGPVNALIPLVVAAQLGLPCLDSDIMLRCFPAIEMTVFTLAGIPASPLFAVDTRGSSVVLDAPSDAGTDSTVSALLRSCMPHMGLVALVSTYRVTAGDCARLTAGSGLTRCMMIGRALRAAHGSPDGLAGFGAVTLFTGVVAELLHRTTGGFPRGVLSIEGSGIGALDDPARVMRIDFQNENLVATEDGVVAVTVPDLINLVDADTGTVMQTIDVLVGQRLHVVAMPVGGSWHTPEGIALAGPRAFGLDVDAVAAPSARSVRS
ncbi:MAG TPA: DUF917 domain-containing protein [Pseudonocardia sp.]|nr:DUF917 domain-containing protein [Pseudonocardia sp.]